MAEIVVAVLARMGQSEPARLAALWAFTVMLAVAFLALLELRRSGEVSLEQAGSFAPIRVRRLEERRPEWTGIARSA